MNRVSVVVIKEGVVDEVILLSGSNRDEASEKAEAIFRDKCATYVSNWDEYTSDDIACCLDDGYVQFGTCGSVCISWPEAIDLDSPAVEDATS